MGNVNLLLQIPFPEYMSMYFIAILFVSGVGIFMTEWFSKRFGLLVTSFGDMIVTRRTVVLKREKK